MRLTIFATAYIIAIAINEKIISIDLPDASMFFLAFVITLAFAADIKDFTK